MAHGTTLSYHSKIKISSGVLGWTHDLSLPITWSKCRWTHMSFCFKRASDKILLTFTWSESDNNSDQRVSSDAKYSIVTPFPKICVKPAWMSFMIYQNHMVLKKSLYFPALSVTLLQDTRWSISTYTQRTLFYSPSAFLIALFSVFGPRKL